MWDDRLISTRALNYLRSVHVPSYVGLRFLLENLPEESGSCAVTTLVEQLSGASKGRIYNVRRFKKFLEGGAAEYRGYSVPSPTHALCEAYGLLYLERAGVRQKQSFVYSYREPSLADPWRNFQFFADGYRRRNADVLEALGDGDVALVFDIKNFYPSVDARKVVDQLLSKPQVRELSQKTRLVIKKCAEACIENTQDEDSGLRVGPEFSHILADVALERLDKEMSSNFPRRYFRYVDDLVVVVARSAVEESKTFIRSALEKYGFKSNIEKEDEADRQVWSGFRNEYLEGGKLFDPLSALKFRIRVFLSRRPDESDALAEELRRSGIYMPISSFQQSAFRKSWREQIRYLLTVRWDVLLKYRFDRISDIVDGAKECQSLLRSQLDRLISSTTVGDGLTRRWSLQKIRFLANRALYLLSDDELIRLAEFIRQFTELSETVAVYDALTKNDFEMLGRMPGPAVSAAAQLAPIRGLRAESIAVSLLSSDDEEIRAEVASQFIIRGYPLSSEKLQLAKEAEGSALLRFAAAEEVDSSEWEEPTFAKELEWLGSQRSFLDRASAASTRLLPGEQVVLEALSLSSSYMS